MSNLLVFARLSYSQGLWEKTGNPQYPDQKPSFNATFILSSESLTKAKELFSGEKYADFRKGLIATGDGLKKHAIALAETHFIGKARPVSWENREIFKLIPRDGAIKDQDGFGPGTWFFTAKSDIRPKLMNPFKKDITEFGDGEFLYSGCYVLVQISLYAYPKQPIGAANKGISANLLSVMHCADGERFSGGSKADMEAFPEIAVPDVSDVFGSADGLEGLG